MSFILFDLDGTLIDSTDAILESFDVAFSAMGDKSKDPKAITALIGHPLDKMFLELGVKEEKVWDYVSAYKNHYRKISGQKTTLLPTAKEAVKFAASYAKLAVVTTKTSQYSKELLEKLEILDAFELLIGREDVLNPKPHPEPIEKALLGLNANKAHSWMVGDTCMDMIAATKAGIKGVGVTCGYGDEKSLQSCASFVAKSPLMAVERILK